jgi:glycosyltransferase involved in cell wall biosynthesis
MPLNVGILIDSLQIGGAQKYVRQLAVGLSRRGHRVAVWVLNDGAHPLYLQPLEAAGVSVTVIGRRAVLSGVALLLLAASCRRRAVDVMVCALFVSEIIGRLAAQLAGGIPVAGLLQARNANYNWLQRSMCRLTAPMVSWTISNSRRGLQWACVHEGVAISRASVILNQLDLPVPPSQQPRWVDLGLEVLEGRRVIGSLGRLHAQKGYDLLLPALAAIPSVLRVGSAVAIWGEGPERRALENQCHLLGLDGFVFFPGARSDVAYLLPKLDLYVQPSRFEGTPNAVMEALAAGVPVLASAVDGTQELGEHPLLELVEGDSQAWAVALVRRWKSRNPLGPAADAAPLPSTADLGVAFEPLLHRLSAKKGLSCCA